MICDVDWAVFSWIVGGVCGVLLSALLVLFVAKIMKTVSSVDDVPANEYNDLDS